MSRGYARIRGAGAIAGLLVLALLTTGLVTDQARAAEEVTPRDKMLALTNQDRTERDKKALKLNAALSRYAARHSADMADADKLVHTSEKALRRKLDKLGIRWTKAGENIGVADALETLEETLASLEKAFMKSTPHRANILEPRYDHAATGVYEANGNVWVTVIFYG